MSMVADALSWWRQLRNQAKRRLGPGPTFGEAPSTDPESDGSLTRADRLHQVVTLGIDYPPQIITTFRNESRGGNPWRLFALYDEMPRLGVGPAINKARNTVGNSDWDIRVHPEEYQDEDYQDQDPNTEKDAPLAREIRNYVDAQLSHRLPDLARDAMDLFFYGICGFEVKTKALAGGDGDIGKLREGITSIKSIPPRRFRIDMQSQEWLLRPEPLSIEGVPIAPYVKTGELFFAELDPAEPLDQKGLFFQCLVPWLVSQRATSWWASWLEDFSCRFRDISFDRNDTDAQPLADKLAKQVGFKQAASHPDSIKIDFKQASGEGRVQHHRDILEWATREYDRLVHGHSQASNVQVDAGSRTSSQNADDQSIALAQSRANKIASELREGIVRPLVARAYGERAAALFTPDITVRVRSRENVKEMAEAFLAFVKAGSTKIPESAVLRIIGEREAGKNEPTLKLPAPAQHGGFPNSSGLSALDLDAMDEVTLRRLAERVAQIRSAA